MGALVILPVATTAQGPTWANASAAPSPRNVHAAAYDSGRDRMVVFGGFEASGLAVGTWEHDGTNWIQHTPAVSPTARAVASVAYDPQRAITMLGGGNPTYVDTWIWNGVSWARGPDCPSLIHAIFWHGGVNAGLYAVAGATGGFPPVPLGTYRFDGSSWVHVGIAPLVKTAASTYVPATGLSYALATGNAMFAFDGTAWQPVGSPTGHPDPYAMTWDIGRNRFVGLGGMTTGPNVTHYGQFISPLQVSWTSVSNANPLTGIEVPSARNNCSLVYDTRRHRPVLFGGITQAGSSNELFSLQNTILGPQWLQKTPVTQNPASRIYGDMVYDLNSDCMVVFGGMDANGPRNDTWIFDGLGWLNQGASAAVSPRLQPCIAHDPALGTILFGGGTIGAGGNTVFNDTYRLSNFAWTPVNVSGAPPARQGHDMVRAWNRIVMFGGYNGTALADTWSLNPSGLGMSWLPMLTLGSPGARQSHAMAFDERRNCLVVFGGADANGQFLGGIRELRLLFA